MMKCLKYEKNAIQLTAAKVVVARNSALCHVLELTHAHVGVKYYVYTLYRYLVVHLICLTRKTHSFPTVWQLEIWTHIAELEGSITSVPELKKFRWFINYFSRPHVHISDACTTTRHLYMNTNVMFRIRTHIIYCKPIPIKVPVPFLYYDVLYTGTTHAYYSQWIRYKMACEEIFLFPA